MRKAIVTGSNGFIGKHLVEELLKNKVKVFAILKSENNSIPLEILNHNDIEVIKCDLDNINLLKSIVPEKDIDILYHLAWDGVKPDSRNNLSKQTKNIEYSMNCIKTAKELGVKKVVLLGSTMEFALSKGPINEETAPTPQTAYGSAKIATRYLCEQLSKDLGLHFIYCVVTSVYGVGREDDNVIHYTIKKLLRQEKPFLTKLTQKWDFIHVKDLVRALVAIGISDTKRGFYSVGRGENKPLSMYIGTVSNLIDESIPLGIGEVEYDNNIIPSSCIDTTYLEQDLGFKANIDFEEGIKEVIEYYRRKMPN